MNERARATGLYAELEVADMLEGQRGRPDACAELVLAADAMVYVADLAKCGNDAGGRNTANVDTGYISQNVYLFCASEGLVTGARGGVNRDALGKRLKLRPDQLIVLGQSVGYRKPGEDRSFP